MIKEARAKYNTRQLKEILKGYINSLEKIKELEKDGDKEGAEKLFNEMKQEAAKKLDEMKLEIEDSGENDEFKDSMWEDCMNESGLYYGLHDKKNQYVGYVAVKDIRKPIWEVAIVLLPQYRYQGYGKVALTILFDELYKRTGKGLFRARVDSDNYESQSLFRKIGARTNGISEFMLHGEDLKQFQKDNQSLIDEKLEAVAEEFCVDVEDLLGHVLEYLIDWLQR